MVVSTLKVLLGIDTADKAPTPKQCKILKKKPREDVDVAKIYESLVVNEEEPANLCRVRFTVPVLCWLWCNYVDMMLIVLKYYGGTLAWRVSQLLYKFCC